MIQEHSEQRSTPQIVADTLQRGQTNVDHSGTSQKVFRCKEGSEWPAAPQCAGNLILLPVEGDNTIHLACAVI